MTKITQGSVISGIRNDKYPNHNCLATVINARCDLEHNKTDKVYYLITLPLKEWMFSSIGFTKILSEQINNVSSSISNRIKNENLSWEDLKHFTVLEFRKVLDSTITKKKEREKLIADFQKYVQITSVISDFEEKKKIVEENKKSVINILKNMSIGKDNDFLLLPNCSLKESTEFESIVIDLRELDYIDNSTADALSNNRIDDKNIKLSKRDKERYNQKFFILSDPGYSTIIDEITSPWIECVVQHFANAFIRIGIENLSESQIEVEINNMLL